jgi:hypothetical protein
VAMFLLSCLFPYPKKRRGPGGGQQRGGGVMGSTNWYLLGAQLVPTKCLTYWFFGGLNQSLINC